MLAKYRTYTLKSSQFSGGNDEKDTPVPIPNTVVKLLGADDTWMETSRESRSLPDLYQASMVYAIGACLYLIQISRFIF